MRFLDLSCQTPQENLALDEALLELCEHGRLDAGCLRFWESSTHFAVLGYSNKAGKELLLEACRKDSIPVLRRPSGGGTVLQGPGCLNYALIMEIPASGPLKTLTGANDFIMETHRKAFEPLLGAGVEHQGITDLTWKGLKFSGNAQRRKRNFFLFHGTFLYDFDLPRIGKYLSLPSIRPEYRADRPHDKFVANVPVNPEKIKDALKKAWKAEGAGVAPDAQTLKLTAEKYYDPAWNLKF